MKFIFLAAARRCLDLYRYASRQQRIHLIERARFWIAQARDCHLKETCNA